MKFGVRPLLVAAGLVALAVPSCLGQAGGATASASSSPVSAEYVPTMTFDVASVRENKDIDMNARLYDERPFYVEYDNVSRHKLANRKFDQ